MWTAIGLIVALALSGVSAGPRIQDRSLEGVPANYTTEEHGIVGRQEAGRCGVDYGNGICPGQQCCSMYGWCGTGTEFCNAFGCQTNFGWCEGEPIPTAPQPQPSQPQPSQPVVPQPQPSVTPPTTPVTPVTPPTVIVPPAAGLTVSSNGMCGNTTTCAGSTFGGCCSRYWYCGSGDAYCGDGCKPGFGRYCGAEPPVVPVVPTIPKSTTGMCGNGTTCAGSSFGNCCSYFFWCGSGSDYCGTNCRKEFGTCT